MKPSIPSARDLESTIRSFIPESIYTAALRSYYKLAIQVVTQLLCRKSYVQKIYLTGSAAAGKLTYGVSDLDFLIEVSDSARISIHKEEVHKIFAQARRFFPQIQPHYEVAIHSSKEIDQVLVYQRPYLFSLPGMKVLLWSREPDIRNLKYEIQHEIPLISRMWRKILLGWCRAEHTPEYKSHILSRVSHELKAIANRTCLAECPDKLLNIQETIKLIIQLLKTIDGTHSHKNFLPAKHKTKDLQIPNMLYFETAPLTLFFEGRKGLPSSQTVRIIEEDNPEEIEKLISSPDRHQIDSILLDGIIFPVRYHPDVRVLTPISHPWTFLILAMSDSVNEIKLNQELLESISLMPKFELVTQQQFALNQLNQDHSLWSKIAATEIEQLKYLVCLWQKILYA